MDSRVLFISGRLLFLLAMAAAPGWALAEAPAAAISSFNAYIGAVESRLARQHRSQSGFIASAASATEASERETRLRKGESIVEQLTPSTGANLPGAMLHDWRGTAFAPGVTAADFERLMKDYNAYPQYFSPQVPRAKVLAQHDDFFHVLMRVRQKLVITVVMDTT